MRKSVKSAWKDKKLIEGARERGLQNFKDPEFIEKFLKGCNTKPNNHEQFLINFLSNFTNGFEYVGNFKVWIGGKNPDFIDKENKKIIEYFGRYWHSDNDENKRIFHFKKYGYKTLVIWEEELKDLVLLKQKIFQFVIN